jgi:hypothetical protein
MGTVTKRVRASLARAMAMATKKAMATVARLMETAKKEGNGKGQKRFCNTD